MYQDEYDEKYGRLLKKCLDELNIIANRYIDRVEEDFQPYFMDDILNEILK